VKGPRQEDKKKKSKPQPLTGFFKTLGIGGGF